MLFVLSVCHECNSAPFVSPCPPLRHADFQRFPIGIPIVSSESTKELYRVVIRRPHSQMMMRRSFALLAVAGKNTVATTLPDITDSSGSQLGVEIAEPPPANFLPPAKEAPELLQAYVEPKPFVSPRRLQLFTVSMAVGALTVGGLYFLLSKTISASVEEEQHEVDRVAERNRLAAMERQKLLPAFTAPTSYEQLHEKMMQHQREIARQETLVATSTSMLHTEVIYHVKKFWNRCLTHIQDAVEHSSAVAESRREAKLKRSIEASLSYNGFRVNSLERTG